MSDDIAIIRSQTELDDARRTLLVWAKTDEDADVLLDRLREHQVRLDASLGLAFAAMQECADVLGRAVQLGKIYFEIAAAAIGEDQVRVQRDARIAALVQAGPSVEESKT